MMRQMGGDTGQHEEGQGHAPAAPASAGGQTGHGGAAGAGGAQQPSTPGGH